MKLLVCTDGSEHSKKALDKAAEIAGGCKVTDVVVMHVYDNMQDISIFAGDFSNTEQVERFRQAMENHKEEKKKYLDDAVKYLADRGIKARSILKEGHPSHTIVNTSNEEEIDMIIIGSRGLGGLKKLFLGSVSNAVIQEAKCSVLTVK